MILEVRWLESDLVSEASEEHSREHDFAVDYDDDDSHLRLVLESFREHYDLLVEEEMLLNDLLRQMDVGEIRPNGTYH